MSHSYDLWVGPYVACTTRGPSSLRTINTCASQSCRYRQQGEVIDGLTCPKCASEVVAVAVEVPGAIARHVHPAETAEQTDGALRLFNAEYGDDAVPVFVPNRHNGALPRAMNIDTKYERQCGEIMQLGPEATADAEAERIWFQSEFRPALSLLRTIYGPSSVEIRWGVLGEIK